MTLAEHNRQNDLGKYFNFISRVGVGVGVGVGVLSILY